MLASWAEQNVDPSFFPKELMANVSGLVGDEEVVLLYDQISTVEALYETRHAICLKVCLIVLLES